MADIEQRGRRLFDAAGGSAARSDELPETGSLLRAGGQRAVRKQKGRFKAADPRPPHARNPHRVGSMAEIKARSRHLFDSSGPDDPARLAKRPSLKPLLINRTASTVAAYFTRQAEQNQLMPAQRRALRRLNKQYFDSRRSVFSDPRLSRQDKAQLVSVLTFERLKAREAIQNPQHHQEVVLMGSAEIRNLIQGAEEETPAPAFSFTGARGPNIDKKPAGIRVQVKGILDKLSQRLDPAQKERDEERERELNAKDLYTRKATFSQNVHYLDKKTDKTLFVDTGKAIVMRRTGISEAGVAVALELAKERFGSTLSINGTAEFKQLVIEAAAKNGIDVHFTDKAMNQALADRRAMLDIEKEGNTLGPSASQPTPEANASAQVARLAPTEFLHNDVVVTVDPADAAAVGVLKTQLESEVDLRSQAIDTTESEISDVEMQISDWADSPGDSAMGVLVKHGFAPYQHDAKNKQSYFVDIDTGAGGVRTIWGADLSRSLDQGQYAIGDRIRLQDLGQVPVQVPEKVEGGGTKLVDAYRREWSVKNADGPSLAELKVQLASAQTLLMTHSAMKAQAESSLAKLAKVATVEASPAQAPAPASSELVVEADNWADAMNAALNSHYDYGQQERSAEYSQTMAATDIVAVAKLEKVGYGPEAVQHEDKTFALDRLMRAARREIDSNPDYRTFIEANAPKELVERIQAAEPLPDREPFAETANSTDTKPGFDPFTDLDPAQTKGPAPIHFVHNGKDVKLDLSRYTVPTANTAEVSATTEPASQTDTGTAPLDLAQLDTKWRADNGLAMDDTAVPDAAMAARGALHAAWVLSGAERSSSAMALIGNLMENQAYKSGFERAVDKPDLRDAALSSRETSELVNKDRVWRQNLGMPESDIVATPTAMEMRGESHANWLYGTADKSPQAIAMLSNYLQDDAYRQGFKRGIDELYALPMLPADRAVLDSAVEFVFDLVNDIEQKKYGQAPASDDVARKAIEGILVEHGSAPYLHNPKHADKPPSYFVTLKVENGESRTVWGVDLERVMSGDPVPFNAGDRVKLSDLGTQPVTVSVLQADGSQASKTANRRVWEGELLEPSRERAVTPVTHTTHAAPEQSTVTRVQPLPVATAAAGTVASVTAAAAVTAVAQDAQLQVDSNRMLILFDEVSGDVWTGERYEPTTDLANAERFTPDESIRKAFELDTKLGGIVEIHHYDASTDQSQKLTTTEHAQAWPVAQSAFAQAGLLIDREEFLASRDGVARVDDQVIEDPSADVGPDLESAPLDGLAEGWAPVETYTDAHIQVEEDGPEMD